MFSSRWSVMFLVSIVGLCSILKITTQTCSNGNEIEDKRVPQVMWLSVVVESGDPAFIDAQLVNETVGSNQGLVTSVACGIVLLPSHLGYVIQIIIDTVTRNIVAESKPFDNFLPGSQILPRYLDPLTSDLLLDSSRDSSPEPNSSSNGGLLSSILSPIVSETPTASSLRTPRTTSTPAPTPTVPILTSSAIMPIPTPPLPPPPIMTNFPNVVTNIEVTSFTTQVLPTTSPTMQSVPHESLSMSFSMSSSMSSSFSTKTSSPVPSSSLTTSDTQLPSTTGTTAYGTPTTNAKPSAAHINEIVGVVLGALAGLGILGGLLCYRRCKKKRPFASDPDPSFMAQHTTPHYNMSQPHSIISVLTEGTVEEPVPTRDEVHFLQQRIDTLQQQIWQVEQQRQDSNMTGYELNFDDPPPLYHSPTSENC